MEDETCKEDNEEMMGKPEHFEEGSSNDLDRRCHHEKEADIHSKTRQSTDWGNSENLEGIICKNFDRK